jgi:hypothetical protein
MVALFRFRAMARAVGDDVRFPDVPILISVHPRKSAVKILASPREP